MTKREHNIQSISSSIRKVLLFLVGSIAPFLVTAGITLNNDTIILDGKKVIVERELTVDTVGTTVANPLEEKKRKKKLSLGTWKGGFRAEGYVPVSVLTTTETGMSSVNSYIGADRRRGNGSGIMLFTEREVGRRDFSITTGIGIDFISNVNFSFDPTQLDDSLLTFANFSDNQLDQVLLFRYELGDEFDTLKVDLKDDPFKTTWLRIPVGALWERAINKEVSLRFGGGVDLRFLLGSNRPDVILLPDLGKDYTWISSDEEAWFYKRFVATPWVSGGVRVAMDRNWWLDIGLKGGFPFSPMASNSNGLQQQTILMSGRIGVMYLFGK